jgi:Homeodomain-like domain
MRAKTYRVELTDAERAELLLLIRRGAAPARAIRRAHILLRASEDAWDADTAAALHTSPATVARTRERFATAPAGERLARALYDRPRPGAAPKLGPKDEAFLIALACSDAPEGRTYWTMQLLADRLVALERVAAISDETVRRVLKKTR